MEISKEKIREQFRKLPQDIQNVISSEEHLNKIQAVGKKFNLHVDQVGQLGEEILLVTLGLLKPKDFIPELSRALRISFDQTQPIAQEVNEQIFRPIRDSLKKIHGLDGSSPLNTEVSTIPTPPTKTPTLGEMANIDDRLTKYISTTPGATETSVPTPQPYTHDPYRESVQ